MFVQYCRRCGQNLGKNFFMNPDDSIHSLYNECRTKKSEHFYKILSMNDGNFSIKNDIWKHWQTRFIYFRNTTRYGVKKCGIVAPVMNILINQDMN